MIGSAITSQWLRPTLRATPLYPLAAITTGVLLVAVVASRRTGQVPEMLVSAAVGGMAGGVVLGLDDEARSTLRASPTSAIVRLGHRLLILLPALVVACLVLLVAERLLFDQRSVLPTIAAVAALVTAGLAIEVWWSRYRPETATDVAVVATLTWALARFATPDLVVVGSFTNAWSDRAWTVLAASAALVVAGAAGRRA